MHCMLYLCTRSYSRVAAYYFKEDWSSVSLSELNCDVSDYKNVRWRLMCCHYS